MNPQDLVDAARAAHDAALEHPAKLAAMLDRSWQARGHTDLISQSLADLEAGRCKRLLITTPPQVGKSTLASEWFPFWWLARHPEHRVIVGSYGTSLANRRGRIVRRMVREHGWRYGMEMEYGAASVAEWSLESGGGLKSVGVGSAVTGSPADCVAAGTLIHTEQGLIPAHRLARMTTPPRIATWNHPRAAWEWNRLRAVRTVRTRHMRTVRTRGGRDLWCTPDHPIYIPGKGYTPAARCRSGDPLLAGNEYTPDALLTRTFPAFEPTREPFDLEERRNVRTTWPLPVRRNDVIVSNRPVDLRGRMHSAFDFQVERSPNFVADGILVHNCAIVDDPHKNRAEAESLVMRDAVWDWWSADITSRLAPRAPICLILTLWHIDDLAARVLAQDGTEEEGGLWRVIRLPAVADAPDDPLGRAFGDPLPHPKIPEQDRDTARDHWMMKRETSLVRDWHALYQADPKPDEGALVTPELMRARRHHPAPVEPQRYGVAVDPAAEGRDLAGVIGGFLGADNRLYVDRDASLNGHSQQWAMAAALLAAENSADFVIYEKSGLLAEPDFRRAFDSAWDAVDRIRRNGPGEFDNAEHARRAQQLDVMPAHPQIKGVSAKKGKLLRAEPVAQQWWDDRMRTASYLPDLESEWYSWQVTDPLSPGRIDASVYLAIEMGIVPGSEALVSTAVGLSRDQIIRESARRPAAQPQMATRIPRRRF